MDLLGKTPLCLIFFCSLFVLPNKVGNLAKFWVGIIGWRGQVQVYYISNFGTVLFKFLRLWYFVVYDLSFSV